MSESNAIIDDFRENATVEAIQMSLLAFGLLAFGAAIGIFMYGRALQGKLCAGDGVFALEPCATTIVSLGRQFGFIAGGLGVLCLLTSVAWVILDDGGYI